MSEPGEKFDKEVERENFFHLVLGMREAQKMYFRTRGRQDLIASKQLEKKVDDILEELFFMQRSAGKPTGIFQEPAPHE